jgi:glycosyltransferase involved in cell wall biosynthesis
MGYFARERGVDVLELPALSRLINPLADLRNLWELYRLFRRERPVIVHTHTAKAGTLGRVAAYLAGVPIRIHTFHGHVLGGCYFSPLVTRIYRGIETLLARLSGRLVVLTEVQKREMAQELKIASPGKFKVIPLGLDLGPFAEVDRLAARGKARTDLGLGEEEVVVGVVGRLVPVKNHELLFKAHSLLEKALGRDVRILVIGSGLRQAELRAFVEDLGTQDRVTWLGWRQNLETLYPAMDALALTSFDEGTPVAVLEALSAGTPVAARAVGGVPEIIDGIPLTRLIGTAEPAAVASALAKVLEAEVGEGERQEVRERIRDRFSVENLVSQMEALYREELGKVAR